MIPDVTEGREEVREIAEEAPPRLPVEARTPVLQVRGLCKRFGACEAVSDISFDLYPGDALALVGPNGAGKTTTLRMLATLLPPDRGSINIMGKSLADPFAVRPLLGFMPDVLGVYPEMLVGEYLEFFARAYQLDENLIGYCIQEVASFAGLTDLLNAPCAGLSRGMLQRVALARALLHDPPLLLLDEPAAGLDPRSRVEFREMLLELRRKGKTAVISSHVLSDLEDTCTRIAVIENGHLLALEGMDDFVQRARAGRTFRVDVVEGADRAFQVLSAREEVSDLRWDEEALLFGMAGNAKAASRVLRALVEAGVEVEGFAEVPYSLEEAYLARTMASNGGTR